MKRAGAASLLRAACVCALILAPNAQATQATFRDGAWSAEGKSWFLRQRDRAGSSARLRAGEPVPAHASIAMVYWRYKLVAPYPSGLKIALCNGKRCAELQGGQGGTSAFAGDRADSEFYFSLFLPGKGAIKPPVHMLQSQVIVNYRYNVSRAD